MQVKTAKALLSRFLRMTEEQVIDAFASLPQAHVGKDRDFVYIPGQRSDRILLVAHADTVNHANNLPEIRWMGDVCTLEGYWSTKGVYNGQHQHTKSLGADDRTGCAALWQLHDGDHSILITTGEESGCAGARIAVKEMGAELGKHSFALEIDRRGDRQAVFYDVSTDPFEEYILDLLLASDPEQVEWTKEPGSCTDIKVICGDIRLCGVNLSAGYVREHSSEEHLYLEAWLHTLEATRKLLAVKKHVRYVLPARALPTVYPSTSDEWSAGRWCHHHNVWGDKCRDQHQTTLQTSVGQGLAKLSNKVTGTTKARIIRVGGDKAGEGYLCLTDDKNQFINSLSKRQTKKLAAMVSRLLSKGTITREEGVKILSYMIQLRDGKVSPAITQAQRDARAAGEYDNSGGVVGQLPKKTSDITVWCWHKCSRCTSWYHVKDITRHCVLSSSCNCPEHGVIDKLLCGDSWKRVAQPIFGLQAHRATQQIAPVAAVQAVERGRITCIHYCTICDNECWSHQKPLGTSGRCKVGDIKSLCPIHCFETFTKVQQYNREAGNTNIDEWKRSKLPASDGDPHDAASVTPRGGTSLLDGTMKCDHDVPLTKHCEHCNPTIVDGKTGAGLATQGREGGDVALTRDHKRDALLAFILAVFIVAFLMGCGLLTTAALVRDL